ncbi:transposase [[Mycoplasma] phocae]|uniref:Transposase n=1 Tax=[Mycoplasma] phocae TaxID=142651 RepID=A0A2Z5IPY4_9BACT|nr:transposase [[Mycoplasma] phocae]AXE60587.1 transposase [[Mycoplasma] phocae]
MCGYKKIKEENYAKTFKNGSLIYQAFKEGWIWKASRVFYIISPDTQFTKRNSLSGRIIKIIKNYNLGTQIRGSTNRKKGNGAPGRPKKQRELDRDIFSRKDLIEIAKRYYEITKENSKKGNKNEAKNLNIFPVFYFSRQTISANKTT